MRRIVVVLVGMSMLLPLGMSSASAATTDRYKSQIFNAYWNHRRKIDRDSYVESQWYVGVYSSGDHFFSDLYKSVSLCTRQTDGRFRCKGKAYWYDSIRKLDTGSFSIDRKLDTGALTATYRLVDERNDDALIGVTTVSVNLTGVGTITKQSYRDTYQQGCNTFRYSSRSVRRGADATGTYQIASEPSQRLGFTADAYMSAGSSLVFSKTC